MKTISGAGPRRVPARWTRPLAAPLGCAALAAVLAACSSAGPAPSASGGGPPAGGSTSVTIGKAVDTIGFTTVDVAKAEGYFAKAGLNVNEDLLSGSSTAFAALESGSVNFACASSTALISAKTKGLPLEAVASLDYGVSLQLLVSDNWIKAHHMSPGQPLGTVMREMVGAKLGVISHRPHVRPLHGTAGGRQHQRVHLYQHGLAVGRDLRGEIRGDRRVPAVAAIDLLRPVAGQRSGYRHPARGSRARQYGLRHSRRRQCLGEDSSVGSRGGGQGHGRGGQCHERQPAGGSRYRENALSDDDHIYSPGQPA